MTPDPSVLEQARNTLLSAQDAMPTAAEVDELEGIASGARERGYLLPDEEDALRFLVTRYLHVRLALHTTIQSMQPLVPRFRPAKDDASIKAFVCAWLAGCMLMRAARYILQHYAEDPLIWKALNQAHPEKGIPAGMFDQIRDSSCRPKTLLRFFQAMRFAETLEEQINTLGQDPDWQPIVKCLASEGPFLEKQKRVHASSFAKTRFRRWRERPIRRYQRVMFGMFEASGRAIAEMRNPFHRKRIRRSARNQVHEVMQPGDVLITRHDDAMSNLFLPGFWPHSAFVLGSEEQRNELGIHMSEDQAERAKAPICILEGKKDGVLFRSLKETLSVDALILLRPLYSSPEMQRKAVERALTHEGKLYDFEFDFTRSDRLVCTEVVYRSLEGHDDFHFDLIRKAGRVTLPAEDLLRQALASGRVEVVALAGVRGNQFHREQRARELLDRSLQA